MNPLRYFYIPLLMLLGLALLLTAQNSFRFGWTPIPPMVGIALVYMFGPQIKWWYWRRYPPELSSRYAPLLDRFPFYLSLSSDGKREFRRKTFLFRANTVYKAQAMPRVPEDVQIFSAASAATVFFGHEQPPYDTADVVVAYPHPFPSPAIQELHRSEFYGEDGVLIFSLPDLVQSVVESNDFMQLALYEYARVYRQAYPEFDFPALDWTEIERLSGFQQAAAEQWHGTLLDRAAITIVLYFSHAIAFRAQLPERFQAVAAALQLSHHIDPKLS